MSSSSFAVPSARSFLRTALIGTATAALVLGSAAVASAAPGITSTDTTEANVVVSSAITLTGLTPTFALAGLPGGVVTEAGAVTYAVETNNLAGYTVTVQATAPVLSPADTVANPDTIPIGALSVQQDGGANFTPLSNTTPVLLQTKNSRSVQGGDPYADDYSVVIPFVNEDTYSVDLTYVATTQ